MKKLYFIIICLISVTSFSQRYEDLEMKGLIENESQRFQKITDYNVNPNTLNYDLQYQRLDLQLDPANYYVSGSVTSHFVPNQNISSIYFDLTSVLTVSQVSYHGTNLSFQQLSTKEIKIDFPSSLASNVKDSLTIAYSGMPDSSNSGFRTATQNGVPVLSTLSEPYGAQDWFPTKQSLNDKIEKVDIKITCPSQYSVASNGKLLSEVVSGTSKLTFWQTNYPIPAYLIGLSITNFTKLNDTIGNPPFPFLNYIYPTSAANPQVIQYLNNTKATMILFEEYFGPYPYRNEKYGHMQYAYGGGMEHATMTSLGGFSNGLIAHELGHQWFGDKLTCNTWNDIWLNEGFATFSSYLSNEKLHMTNSQFMDLLLSEKDYITSQPDGSVYVPDSGLGNVGRIFNSRLSYAKGAFVLRMMKWILGDYVFYQALRDYNSRPNLAYKYVRTIDFNTSVLQSTGKDFTGFLNDWIYGQGYPTYMIKWNQIGSHLLFNVNQVQSHSSVSFFELPLPIKVNGTNGETAYLALDNSSNNQNFDESINFTVSSIEFNYEYQIVESNSAVVKDPTLILSVEDLTQNSVKIYPNPVKEILNISGITNQQNYQILSIDGKVLKNGTTEKSINVNQLSKGVYLLKLEKNTFKFIKE